MTAVTGIPSGSTVSTGKELGATTSWPTEQLVHSRIPADLTDPDNPQPRSLFYRVRRVTVQNVASDWSATVTGIMSLVETGDIPANTITANMVTTTFLETAFLDISGHIVIGYTGSGTPSAPNEGDKRLYIDGTKIAFEEYTGGAWSAVNGVKVGGLDSNNFLYPIIQCRGMINPLADEVNTEFYPGGDFHHLTFEVDYSDQNGLTPDSGLTENVTRTTSWKKFGSYSLFATSGNRGTLAFTDVITLGNNLSVAEWINITVAEQDVYISSCEYRVDASNLYHAMIYYHSSAGKFEAGFKEMVSGAYAQDVSVSLPVSVADVTSKPHYIGFILSFTEQKFYLIVDNSIASAAITPLTLSDAKTSDYMFFRAFNDYGSTGYKATMYCDDIIFSLSDNFNTDVLIQHYNHNQPWNTEYSAKDLILKPAEGGKVIIDDVEAWPIGSTYIQFPGKSAPAALGLPGTWSNISSSFAGNFFRAEGGNASAFNAGQQGDAIRQISGSFYGYDRDGRRISYGTSGAFGGGTSYGPVMDVNGSGNTTSRKSVNFYASRVVPTSVENRPLNRTIRIWERIS